MPILPFPRPADVTQLDVRQAGVPQSARGGDAYGAQAFREEAAAFGELQQAGAAAVGLGARQQASVDQQAVATDAANHSFQKDYNDNVIGQTDATGAQLMPTTEEKFNKYMDDILAEFAKSGASPAAIKQRRLQLLTEKRQYMDNAAVTSSKMAEVAGTRALDTGITTFLNDIGNNGATDQKSFEAGAVKQEAAIDAKPGVPQNVKDQKKLDMRHQAAILRFETLMYPKVGGQTKEGIEALQKELEDPYWQKQLETSALDKIRSALATSRSAFAELSVEGQTSEHVNRVAGHPEDYESELANLLGVDKSGLDGVKIKASDRSVVSDMTRVRFEALGEQAVTGGDEAMMSGKAKTKEEAEKAIIALQKDLVDNPVWGKRLTGDQFRSLKDSLQTRKNALDKDWNELQRNLTSEHGKQVELQKADVAGTAANFEERLKKGRIPQQEFQAWLDARLKLGDDNLTTSQGYLVRRVHDMQVAMNALGDHPTQAQIDAANASVDAGGSGTGVHHSPTPGGRGSDGSGGGVVSGAVRTGWQSGLQRFNISRYGRTAVTNIEPSFGSRLNDLLSSAPPDIQREIRMSSGWRSPDDPRILAKHQRNPKYVANPLTSFHGKGQAVDFQTSSNRAIAWLHQHAGEHGIVFPLDGSGNLPNEPWHAEPVEARRGGAAATRGGGGGGFERALVQFESGGKNVWNTHETTRYGPAGGFFQIINRTWERYGGLETGYKQAVDAPYEVQAQIAGKIRMSEWDPKTLAKLRKAGFTVDPDKTLAENIAANGGTLGDGSGGGGGSDGGRASLLSAPRSEQQQNTYDAIANAQKTLSDGLANNTVEYGAAQQNMTVITLDPNNSKTFEARAGLYNSIDQFNHGLAANQQNPLTPSDVTTIDNVMKSTDTAAKLAWSAGIATWSQAMQDAAWKQIGTKAPFAAIAGKLAASGQEDLARSAFRGDQTLTGYEAGGAKVEWKPLAETWFTPHMGDAIRGLDQITLSGLKHTVDSIYADKYGVGSAFDAAKYQAVAEDVMGKTLGVVNGMTTWIPKGATDTEMTAAMQPGGLDWEQVSLTHTPPMARDPMARDPAKALTPVLPSLLAEAKPIYIGNNRYTLVDEKGNRYLTQLKPNDPNFKKFPNGWAVYAMELDARTIKLAAQTVIENVSTAAAAAAGTPSGVGLGITDPSLATGAPSDVAPAVGELPAGTGGAEPGYGRGVEAVPTPGQIDIPPPAPGVPSAIPAEPGMVEQGNIDIHARQRVYTSERAPGGGEIATVRSMSFEDKQGREVLVPTVIDGKVVSNKAAREHYYKTGEHLGIFSSPEAADAYAEKLHQQQAREYVPTRGAAPDAAPIPPTQDKELQTRAASYGDLLKQHGMSDAEVKAATKDYLDQLRAAYVQRNTR